MFSSLIEIDISLLQGIRETLYIDADWYRVLVHIIADLQWVLIALFLIGLWLTGTFKKDNAYKIRSLNIFYMIVAGFALYVLLNQMLPVRPRPELFSQIDPLIKKLPDNSFPS